MSFLRLAFFGPFATAVDMGPACLRFIGPIRRLVLLARLGTIGLLVCANTLWTTNLWAQGRKPSEYEVKAAFLFNFARFVEWPDSTAQDPLRICIVGAYPFGTAFETVLGRSAGRQPVHVERLVRDECWLSASWDRPNRRGDVQRLAGRHI
jgi:hypothetical protein